MANGIARVGQDSAGGPQMGNQNTTVFVNGTNAVVRGDRVAGHGTNQHSAPTMVGASGSVYVGGKPICRQGDSASCGHTSTGSSTVFAG